VTQYEDTYRLCYLRGPEGIIVALPEPPGDNRSHFSTFNTDLLSLTSDFSS